MFLPLTIRMITEEEVEEEEEEEEGREGWKERWRWSQRET